MRISFLAVALACASPAVAVAAADKPHDDEASAAKPAESQAPADKHDKNHQVCRMETATGSVMPKRVCHTVAELDAMQAQAAETKQALRR
jgi:hypothetical protein